MKEYMEKLYHKLHEAMEKPVTLGSAEEVGLYAKTIRRLEKLDCREDQPEAAERPSVHLQDVLPWYVRCADGHS